MTETNGKGTLDYKKITYSLLAALVGLIIYTFLTTVQSIKETNAEQSAAIVDLQGLTTELGKSNALLSQIVQQHEAKLKTLNGKDF